MPTAPAGVGESEPGQLPEGGMGEKERWQKKGNNTRELTLF